MTARFCLNFLTVALLWLWCMFRTYAQTGEKSLEISNKPDVLSCIYSGVKDEEGKTVVALRLKNLSGKEISNIFAGFRIRKKSSNELVYATGVTYGFPIKPGETKTFTLFRWLPMSEEVRKALVDEEKEHIVQLVIDEIICADGTSIK